MIISENIFFYMSAEILRCSEVLKYWVAAGTTGYGPCSLCQEISRFIILDKFYVDEIDLNVKICLVFPQALIFLARFLTFLL